MNVKEKISRENTHFAFGLLVFFFLLFKGVNIGPDSIGYIETIPIRSAGYSLVIIIFKSLFGKYVIQIVFILQLIFVFVAIQYFLNYLKRKFQLKWHSLLLISFVYYYYWFKYGSNLSTEPISYGLFLILIKNLLDYLFSKNQNYLRKSFLFFTLILLFRSQFYFLFPVFLFVLVYNYWQEKKLLFFLLNLSILVGVFISSNLVDRTYHYFQHGKFIQTPFTGLQLVTDALYVSNRSDAKLFNNKLEKEAFTAIIDSIERKGLTLKSLKNEKPSVGPSEVIYHYTHSYNDICHRNAKVILSSYLSSSEGINHWKEIDEISMKMARKIILNNPIDFFKLYVYDILRNGFYTNGILIFFIISFLYSVHRILWIRNDHVLIFLVLSSMCLVFNFLLVALVEPILNRYSFYTSILYFTGIFIIINQFGLSRVNEN